MMCLPPWQICPHARLSVPSQFALASGLQPSCLLARREAGQKAATSCAANAKATVIADAEVAASIVSNVTKLP